MHGVEQAEVRDWGFPRGVASVGVMVEYAGEHGVSAPRLLAGTGLTPAVLTDPDRQIEAHTELTVVRALVRALGADDAGAAVGRRYRISTFGIFGFACVTSATLREAISLALRYYSLGFAFCTPEVEWGEHEVLTRFHYATVPADLQWFLVQRDIVAIHRVMSDLLGRPCTFTRAEFAFPAPPNAATLTAALGVEPCFDRPRTLFGVPSALLTQPLPQANQATWAMCVAQCRDLVSRRRARTGIAADVRERLFPGPSGPPTLDAVAAELAMSTRTLRRRLAAAGTSYRGLLDEVRRTLAEELLAATPMSVDDIALRLGYAEATPFIHAFKRWTGTTPAAYRRTRLVPRLPGGR
ncbi:AraC family transcriptional regulator [Nocardia harenae]|uniref:AraC family transcriptional regulator n=1 Tax=Nocardia harenae TaxID=358707 RepID=UPI00082B48B6|nr:AraC family transcriptional regulator [Nocardia harenae]